MPGLERLPEGAMRISVGIDIAKEVHWITAIDADGVVRIDRKLDNTPAATKPRRVRANCKARWRPPCSTSAAVWPSTLPR